jgi:hypothetical protein
VPYCIHFDSSPAIVALEPAIEELEELDDMSRNDIWNFGHSYMYIGIVTALSLLCLMID